MSKSAPLEKAYILYTRPWSEHSQMAYVFSRDQGMVYVAVKGANRPYSLLRPALCLFQPLHVKWTGRQEIKTLTVSEPFDFFPIKGQSLSSAWYMNELLISHLMPEDAYPLLWDAYHQSLKDLSSGQYMPAMILRKFEWVLLKEFGYGIQEPIPSLDNPVSEPFYRQCLHQQMDLCLNMGRIKTRKVFYALNLLKKSVK